MMSQEADGSRLCLECGLCCQGILHGSVKIRIDEIPAVRRLGLPVVDTDDGPAFPQPCRCHQENRCTVYAERPSACRTYRCKLLKGYEEGSLTWDESVLRVRQVREIVTRLTRRLGPESTASGLWRRLQDLDRETHGASPDRSELLLDAAALLVLSQTHFHDRGQPVEASAP